MKKQNRFNLLAFIANCSRMRYGLVCIAAALMLPLYKLSHKAFPHSLAILFRQGLAEKILRLIATTMVILLGSLTPGIGQEATLKGDPNQSLTPGIGQEVTLKGNPNVQINVRSQPTANSRRLGYGLAGDRVTIIDRMVGVDGYLWYRVRFSRSGRMGWIPATSLDLPDPNAPTAAKPPGVKNIILSFQSEQMLIQIFNQDDETFMDIYDSQSGATLLNRVPVIVESSPEGTSYLYEGNITVRVFQAIDGTRTIELNNK
jgi:Bacterial SH3 domain